MERGPPETLFSMTTSKHWRTRQNPHYQSCGNYQRRNPGSRRRRERAEPHTNGPSRGILLVSVPCPLSSYMVASKTYNVHSQWEPATWKPPEWENRASAQSSVIPRELWLSELRRLSLQDPTEETVCVWPGWELGQCEKPFSQGHLLKTITDRFFLTSQLPEVVSNSWANEGLQTESARRKGGHACPQGSVNLGSPMRGLCTCSGRTQEDP